MIRRIAIAAAAAALLGLLLVLLVHAPFVRARVLQYVMARAESEYGLRIEASRLDYNLRTLRVGLADLRVAAASTPNTPFFEAGYLAVSVPWDALTGDFALDAVAADGAAVRIVRDAEGRLNLPESETTTTGEPAALRIGSLSLPQMAVSYVDDQAGLSIDVPEASITLTPDEGRIALGAPAVFRAGERVVTVRELASDATFDGRTLHLENATVAADEASLRASGDLTLIASEPAIALSVDGTGDLARLAALAMSDGEPPAGTLAFTGDVRGPLADLTADVALTSPSITWQGLTAANASASAVVTSIAVDVQQMEFDIEGGHINGSALVPFGADAPARANLGWTSVPAIPIVRALAPATPVLPATVTSGMVTAEGPLATLAQWAADGRVRLVPLSNARGRIALGGQADLQLRDGSWRLNGQHVVGGVAPLRLVLSGPVDGGALSGTVTLAPTDIPSALAVLNVTGLADVPDDAVTAGALEGEVRISGTVAAPRLGMTLRAPELVAQGQAVENVQLAASLAGNNLQVDALTAQQQGGAGTLRLTGSYHLTRRSYDVTADVAQWTIAPTEALPARGVAEGRFTGAGTIDSPAGAGMLLVRNAGWDRFAAGDIEADVQLTDGQAVVDARAPAIDLAALLAGIETPVPVAGVARASVHAEAPITALTDVTATGELEALDARAGDLPVQLTEPARVRYADDRVVIERAEATAGDVRISASGEIAAGQTDATEPAPELPGILIAVSGDVDQVARAVAATGITSLPITGGTGPLGLLARVSGTLRSPVISADVDAGPSTIVLQDLPPIRDITLRARIDEGHVDLREATATFQGARLVATGDAPLALLAGGAPDAATPDTISLFVRATDVSPLVLEPFLDAATVEQLSGSIDITADLASTRLNLEDVTGTVTLNRLDVRVADLPVTQRVPTSIVFGAGFARVEAWDWTGQGATLGVRGQVRLSDLQSGLLADGTIDMRLLTPFMRDAGLSTVGTLRPRLSITGPINNPRIDGDLTLTGGELRLADPRLIVSDLSVRAALSRTTATITSLTGTANGGPLTGTGNVQYLDGGRISAMLTTSIRSMAMMFPQGLRSELDANLTATLTTGAAGVPPSGSVVGTVTVVRGAYREPLAVMTGLLTTMRTQRLRAGRTPSPTLDGLVLNIRLVTDEDLIVDNNYGRFQIGGDLRVIGTASAPALSGRLELREGGQMFVGRNTYRINFGTIDFANPVTIEPDLNIEVTTRAGGENIVVTLTGTPDALNVSLAAPDAFEPLGQAEIASLLLTGQRFENLSPGDAAFVGSQVVGNLSAEVLGFAGRAVGLDTIRLGGVDTSGVGVRRDPTAVAVETDPTTRLTFGKSLRQDLEITFSQSLRNGAAQTWILDYQPIRRFDVRFVSNDENLGTLGFRHDLTFGGPPRIRSEGVSQRLRREERVATVTLTGELVFPESDVRRQLRLEPGDRFDFADWQDDRDRLERFYRRQGYLTARIRTTRSESDPVTLTYEITPGPRTAIVVNGISLDGDLRTRLEQAWADAIVDSFFVEEAQQIVADRLAADRYLTPVVDARVEGDDTEKTLFIDVEPGGRSERLPEPAPQPLPDRPPISSITYTGTIVLPTERVQEATALDAGDPYDLLEADAARSRLITLYRFEGFATPAVEVDAVPDSSGGIELTFTIDPGPRQVLGAIEITGNRGIDTDVIVRAIGIERGAPLTTGDLLRARTRLFDTGLFRRVDVAAEEMEVADPAQGDEPAALVPMRVRVTVEEWPALQLRYGFQVAQERPEGEIEGTELVPGLSADLTRRTLFGRAIATGAVFQYQRREQSGRLFLRAPTLLGWPVASSVVLERSRESFAADTLVTDTSGISWEQRTRLFDKLTLAYAYRFERNRTFDTEPDPNDPVGPFDITVNIARLTGTAAWDTRDDPLNSRRGTYLSWNLEWAPESVGSDIRFIRQLAQGYYFRPWRDVVFASAARFGVVRPLGGQQLIPSERFFAGGARTVRGVTDDGLGERDFFGEPAGGEAMLVLNQEVRVPLYRWLGGVAFVDAGNVFTRPRDLSLRRLVGALGAGVRLDTPFALLRADWAKPVWPESARGSSRWTFGIGQSF